MSPHTHDCTGPDGRCPCGYQFTVPRYVLSIEVYDNETHTELVNEGFNTDGLSVVVAALRKAADAVNTKRFIP